LETGTIHALTGKCDNRKNVLRKSMSKILEEKQVLHS
jgi:hypothetical protein